MFSRIERRRLQEIISADGIVFVEQQCYLPAYIPDEVVRSFDAKPCFQHVAYAEAFALTSEEAPCALQPKPELHKTFFIVLNLIHSFIIENDQNDLDHHDH